MTGYLLDTNVLSEVIRKKPEPSVLARLRQIAPDSVFTSVVCVTELRYGARRHHRADVLWDRIARDVLSRVRTSSPGGRRARGPSSSRRGGGRPGRPQCYGPRTAAASKSSNRRTPFRPRLGRTLIIP